MKQLSICSRVWLEYPHATVYLQFRDSSVGTVVGGSNPLTTGVKCRLNYIMCKNYHQLRSKILDVVHT